MPRTCGEGSPSTHECVLYMNAEVVYRWSADLPHINQEGSNGVMEKCETNWGSIYLGLLLVSFRGNGGQEWNEGQSKLQRKFLGKGDKQNGQHRRSLTLLETGQEFKPSRCRSSSEQMQA